MGRLGEVSLIQYLIDPDALDTLAREGLDVECVPTEDLRKVYTWAMDVYFRSGRTKPPSINAFQEEWGDLLSDHEIDMAEDPEDSIEWVIDDLKGSLLHREVANFNKALAVDMADSVTAEKVQVVTDYANYLVSLSLRMQAKDSRMDVREALSDALRNYDARAADKAQFYGLTFGLPLIDSYTRGIHPGELAVLAAGPKVGKSWFMGLVALREWEAGRIPALFSLENSNPMTLDRIICLAQEVDYRGWQQGDVTQEERERVQVWIDKVQGSDIPFHIVRPQPGNRGVESIVRQAQLLGADSLLIDQLTFMEVEDERAARYLQIRELTHSLKTMVSMARKPMPCLLAHQISREGVKAADKAGHLEMYHLAEGSEVERTADWAFGIHRSEMERSMLRAKFQTLASRREDVRHFEMTWSVDTGFIAADREISLERDKQ